MLNKENCLCDAGLWLQIYGFSVVAASTFGSNSSSNGERTEGTKNKERMKRKNRYTIAITFIIIIRSSS